MLQTGMLVNGRYEVTGLIGKGGMSQVFRARDRVTGADLAIKEALKTGTKDSQTAELGLSVEGNLLKRLSNPHLPKIYEVIEDRDDIMIVMDYVEGQSLDKVIRQFGAVSPEKVIEWGIQICDVFHYLHTQNPPIIYRDMKPANVILQPNGNIMMIDFGTARRWKVDANRTSDTMLIGTEGFAAPEQFGGMGQSDARTDIFCLGATMFNLVTAHSPYLKPFGITPLGDWNPALKDCPLDQIIQKCTANDPYERFQTAMELQEALIAAREAPGKTGLFGLGVRGLTKKNKGWQAPVMKVSTGESRILSGKEGESGSQENSGFIKAELATANIVSEGYTDQVLPLPDLPPVAELPPEPALQSAEAPKNESIWKMLAIVGVAAGLILLGLAAVMLFLLEDALIGIIMAIVAVLIAAFGVVSVFQYVKGL